MIERPVTVEKFERHRESRTASIDFSFVVNLVDYPSFYNELTWLQSSRRRHEEFRSLAENGYIDPPTTKPTSDTLDAGDLYVCTEGSKSDRVLILRCARIEHVEHLTGLYYKLGGFCDSLNSFPLAVLKSDPSASEAARKCELGEAGIDIEQPVRCTSLTYVVVEQGREIKFEARFLERDNPKLFDLLCHEREHTRVPTLMIEEKFGAAHCLVLSDVVFSEYDTVYTIGNHDVTVTGVAKTLDLVGPKKTSPQTDRGLVKSYSADALGRVAKTMQQAHTYSWVASGSRGPCMPEQEEPFWQAIDIRVNRITSSGSGLHGLKNVSTKIDTVHVRSWEELAALIEYANTKQPAVVGMITGFPEDPMWQYLRQFSRTIHEIEQLARQRSKF